VFFIFVFEIFGATQVSNAVMWVVLLISIILGVCMAYLFYKLRRVFFCCLGGVVGYFVALILYAFLLRYINSNPIVVYWLTFVCCVILGVLFGLYMAKHMVIISTSLIGSYMLVKGPSFVIGGFPNEGTVIDLINRGEYQQLSTLISASVYIYFVIFLVLLVGGLFVQYYFFTEEDLNRLEARDVEATSISSTTPGLISGGVDAEINRGGMASIKYQ